MRHASNSVRHKQSGENGYWLADLASSRSHENINDKSCVIAVVTVSMALLPGNPIHSQPESNHPLFTVISHTHIFPKTSLVFLKVMHKPFTDKTSPPILIHRKTNYDNLKKCQNSSSPHIHTLMFYHRHNAHSTPPALNLLLP